MREVNKNVVGRRVIKIDAKRALCARVG